MTKDETRAMIMLIKANYSYAFKGMTETDIKLMLGMWHEVFGKYDSKMVRYALMETMKRSKFAPSIAELNETIQTLTGETSAAEDDWKEACKLIRKGNWLTDDEWMATSEHIRLWFGSKAAVREFANQDPNTLQTVTRGQFFKTIASVKDRCRVQRDMPVQLKQVPTEPANEMLREAK